MEDSNNENHTVPIQASIDVDIIFWQSFKQTRNHWIILQQTRILVTTQRTAEVRKQLLTETHSKTAQKHSHVQSALLSKFWLTLLSYSHNDILVLKINWEGCLGSLLQDDKTFLSQNIHAEFYKH